MMAIHSMIVFIPTFLLLSICISGYSFNYLWAYSRRLHFSKKKKKKTTQTFLLVKNVLYQARFNAIASLFSFNTRIARVLKKYLLTSHKNPCHT